MTRFINILSVVIMAAAAVLALRMWVTIPDDSTSKVTASSSRVEVDPARLARIFQAASTGHRLGSDDAPVVLLLYSDYGCPFCRRFARTLQVVRQRYPQHLAIVVKSFASRAMNESTRLYMAAECAADQGVFGDFHSEALRLGELQERTPHWEDVADSVDIPDRSALVRCVSVSRYAERLENDYQEARRLGVQLVPTFFINGSGYAGAMGEQALDSAVAEALTRTR